MVGTIALVSGHIKPGDAAYTHSSTSRGWQYLNLAQEVYIYSRYDRGSDSATDTWRFLSRAKYGEYAHSLTSNHIYLNMKLG